MSKFFYVIKNGRFNSLSNKKVSLKQLVCESNIYNLDELKSKYSIKASDASEFLFKFIKLKGLFKALDEIDGAYSLAYSDSKSVFLARDIIGLKPIWYSISKGLVFSSIKNDLEDLGFEGIHELEPSKVLEYSIRDDKINFIDRSFFSISPELSDSQGVIVKKLSELFVNSVKKRIPDKKFGIAFSGGIDSTLIALVCKKLGFRFKCYTSYFSHPDMKISEDLVYAKRVAKSLGFDLKCIKLELKDAEVILKKTVHFLGPDVVKVGVALPVFAVLRQAKKDGCDFVFSGLGSEELFAGYLRHKLSSDVNKECLLGLLNMYERDTYRDYLLANINNVNVETPFLDTSLISYSLRIPPSFKLKEGIEKFIIREVAINLGMPNEFAFRKKRAAQYGSNSDKALAKLSRSKGFKFKADYLKSVIYKMQENK